jgi:hypothetical protein
MFSNQQIDLHSGLPFFGIVFRLGQFRDVVWAASRNAIGGFRPGNMIGSKNRSSHDTNLTPLREQARRARCDANHVR